MNCDDQQYRYLIINSTDRNNVTDSPANFNINLPYGITFKYCKLIEFYLPNSYYNITSTNNQIVVTDPPNSTNETTYNITPGCYNSDELLLAIKNTISSISSITFNSITSQVVINTSHSVNIYFPQYGSIAQILGFIPGSSLNGTVFNSVNSLSLDQYNVYLESDIFGSNHMSSNKNYMHPCFCIANNVNKNDIITYNENSQFQQILTSNNHNNIIYNLNIQLKDSYGNILQGCGEYSFMLAFF